MQSSEGERRQTGRDHRKEEEEEEEKEPERGERRRMSQPAEEGKQEVWRNGRPRNDLTKIFVCWSRSIRNLGRTIH